MNVNQQMLRPLMQNVTILVLFMLPVMTMRTYSEEKRSGTIELLLTSPLTDFQIVMGKFLGALALYAVMLAVTLIHVALLFVYGRPGWKPIVTSYLGLLLLGGCFISRRAVHLDADEEPDRRRHGTFAVFLFLWVITWIGRFSRSDSTASDVSICRSSTTTTTSTKGVIDTTHLIYYVSFITFGLFLTAKSVDTERWRG